MVSLPELGLLPLGSEDELEETPPERDRDRDEDLDRERDFEPELRDDVDLRDFPDSDIELSESDKAIAAF